MKRDDISDLHSDLDVHASSEFADFHRDVLPFYPQFAWSRLFHTPALWGLAALVGGLPFLLPDRSTPARALVLAIVVAVWAVVVRLADDLENSLTRPLDVATRWVSEERFVVGGDR